MITVKQASPDQKNPFAEMLRRQSEANSFPRTFGLRGNMAPSHGHRNMRNGRHRNQGRGGGRYNRNNRSNKHNGQSKSQPTLITQTRSLESSESSSKPTEDASEMILKEITAKTEEISLTK